jgi:hypothetical protein
VQRDVSVFSCIDADNTRAAIRQLVNDAIQRFEGRSAWLEDQHWCSASDGSDWSVQQVSA